MSKKLSLDIDIELKFKKNDYVYNITENNRLINKYKINKPILKVAILDNEKTDIQIFYEVADWITDEVFEDIMINEKNLFFEHEVGKQVSKLI